MPSKGGGSAAGLGDPILSVRFSDDALPDFDYATGAAQHGLQVVQNIGHVQGGAPKGDPILAIMDSGAGTQVLRWKPNTDGGRFDGTALTSAIMQLTAPIADDLKSLINSYMLRVTLAAGGFGVVGVNDTALVAGIADNPTAVPGSAAGSITNHIFVGNIAGVTSRRVESIAAGVLSNIVNSGYIGTANDAWFQHRVIAGEVARSQVDLKDHNGDQFLITGGATGLVQSVFRNSHQSAVHGFVTVHDIGGLQPIVDIAAIDLYAMPGRVA